MNKTSYVLSTLFLAWIMYPGYGIQEYIPHMMGYEGHTLSLFLGGIGFNIISKVAAVIVWIIITWTLFDTTKHNAAMLTMILSVAFSFFAMGKYTQYFKELDQIHHDKRWWSHTQVENKWNEMDRAQR